LSMAQAASEQLSTAESQALMRHECRAPGGDARNARNEDGFGRFPGRVRSGEFSLSWSCPMSNNQNQL
jgi:hypothetical protein